MGPDALAEIVFVAKAFRLRRVGLRPRLQIGARPVQVLFDAFLNGVRGRFDGFVSGSLHQATEALGGDLAAFGQRVRA